MCTWTIRLILTPCASWRCLFKRHSKQTFKYFQGQQLFRFATLLSKYHPRWIRIRVSSGRGVKITEPFLEVMKHLQTHVHVCIYNYTKCCTPTDTDRQTDGPLKTCLRWCHPITREDQWPCHAAVKGRLCKYARTHMYALAASPRLCEVRTIHQGTCRVFFGVKVKIGRLTSHFKCL